MHLKTYLLHLSFESMKYFDEKSKCMIMYRRTEDNCLHLWFPCMRKSFCLPTLVYLCLLIKVTITDQTGLCGGSGLTSEVSTL